MRHSQRKIRVFTYLPEVDGFDVTHEYKKIAEALGISEWHPAVWIGRLFCMDNDFGEHWFDNWEIREGREAICEEYGLEADTLFFIDPDRFQDGKDGPCHNAAFRAKFWKDVLISLELSLDTIFEEARNRNQRGNHIPDLEDRIAKLSQ